MSLLERMANGDLNSQRAEAAMAFIIKRRLHEWCRPESARGRTPTESVSIRLSRLTEQQPKTCSKVS